MDILHTVSPLWCTKNHLARALLWRSPPPHWSLGPPGPGWGRRGRQGLDQRLGWDWGLDWPGSPGTIFPTEINIVATFNLFVCSEWMRSKSIISSLIFLVCNVWSRYCILGSLFFLTDECDKRSSSWSNQWLSVYSISIQLIHNLALSICTVSSW